jgi:hypothetical protein
MRISVVRLKSGDFQVNILEKKPSGDKRSIQKPKKKVSEYFGVFVLFGVIAGFLIFTLMLLDMAFSEVFTGDVRKFYPYIIYAISFLLLSFFLNGCRVEGKESRR